jgi:hypothetical protein
MTAVPTIETADDRAFTAPSALLNVARGFCRRR